MSSWIGVFDMALLAHWRTVEKSECCHVIALECRIARTSSHSFKYSWRESASSSEFYGWSLAWTTLQTGSAYAQMHASSSAHSSSFPSKPTNLASSRISPWLTGMQSRHLSFVLAGVENRAGEEEGKQGKKLSWSLSNTRLGPQKGSGSHKVHLFQSLHCHL